MTLHCNAGCKIIVRYNLFMFCLVRMHVSGSVLCVVLKAYSAGSGVRLKPAMLLVIPSVGLLQFFLLYMNVYPSVAPVCDSLIGFRLEDTSNESGSHFGSVHSSNIWLQVQGQRYLALHNNFEFTTIL